MFTAERPNQRRVADITEFPTGEGRLYLAGVRDLCDRGLIGWSIGAHQDAELVVDALVMALGRGEADDGLIHHSDRGSQYTSLDFCAVADLAGLQVSFGSTGQCFDTPPPWRRSGPRSSARSRGSADRCGSALTRRPSSTCSEFIEVFYNRQRHQAGLGHLTPAEYAARLAR